MPWIAGAVWLCAACAQDVNVRVAGPHTRVVFDGRDLGAVEPEGERVSVRPGMAPLAFVIEDGEATKAGTVARTEPVPWLVALGAGGALSCAPALALAGFCVANPGVIGAPVAFAATGDVGALTASFVSPSWLTLPLVTTFGALGLAPLGLAFIAENLPHEVVLEAAPGTSTAPEATARMDF